MRGLSLCATAVLMVATLQVSAQQPARGAQPKPATPSTPPAKRAAPGTTAAPAPRKEASVPFQVGETLTYDVAWSQFLVAGSAVARVVEKRSSYNSSAYYIVAEGRPIPLIARFYSVYYKMDSLLDSFTTLSQRMSIYQEEGTRKRYTSTTFNRSRRRAQFEVQAEPVPLTSDFAVPQNVQDGLSTLYALRSRTLRAGDRLSIPVTNDGAMYTANFEVTGPEAIKVPMGQIDAWNLRIQILDANNQAAGQNIGAWISTDARRLPVKLQADLPVGSFVLALRNVQ
jgi:Protein of unknown function (DUF3108)